MQKTIEGNYLWVNGMFMLKGLIKGWIWWMKKDSTCQVHPANISELKDEV